MNDREPTKTKYDVAIIGSGIGGSTLAAVLARQGLKVIVFEAGVHPKFAIGESMILETSEAMRALAEFYDVPELAYYSSENYFNTIGTQHGVKRHFSFLYHTPGQPQDVRQSLQAVIPKQPYGHEIHIYRQDSDSLLTSIAISYGATVLQSTPVKDIVVQQDGVEVVTDKDQVCRAAYLVDATGMRSLLANKLGWRRRDLKSHTRTIFTHMVDVPCYNGVGAAREQYGHPYRLSEGTLHHVFRGGWLWVIPFNNHPDDEADVARTVAQIRALFGSFKWLSSAFRDLLAGKNHLPNNKLRVNLLNRTDGFLGDGVYNAHFFGDASLANLAVKAVREQVRYSVPALNRQRRTRARLATQIATEGNCSAWRTLRD
jgi:2-polyprenyl-6-methoxyphenol hydroxylase-like FAD-dependent oxidoreductase